MHRRQGEESMLDAALDPSLNAPAGELPDWIAARVDFFLARTVHCSTPLVPEIALHLGSEAVSLWDAIARAFGHPAGIAPPYWAFAWPGGQALARYILDHPQLVAGRRVLDLASGCGIVGIAAARTSAQRVLAHDIDPFAVIAIAMNAEANRAAVEASAVDLLCADSKFDCGAINLVLAGDAFYDHELAIRATAFLRRCRDAGVAVLLGDPGRAALPKNLLRQRGEYLVPVAAQSQYTAAGEAVDRVLTAVWEFQPTADDPIAAAPGLADAATA
jgi:predicted nicotinamide N-methyase